MLTNEHEPTAPVLTVGYTSTAPEGSYPRTLDIVQNGGMEETGQRAFHHRLAADRELLGSGHRAGAESLPPVRDL